MKWTRFEISVCTFLIAARVLTGQVADANLSGTVTDASNAAIVKAAVELVNDRTSVRLHTTTDENGQYRFLNVLSGSYALSAEAPGFARGALSGVLLELNRTHTANLRLEIETAATSVTVREAAVSTLR